MATETPDLSAPAGQPNRDYVFAGMAALLVLFVGLTVRGDPITALIPPAVGAIALVFRTPALPIVFLFVLSYLLVFPLGVPFYWKENDVAGSQFRLQDLLVVAAALAYLICQYRSFGLSQEGMPSDTSQRVGPPVRRPAEAVPADEFPRMLRAVAAFVLAGQVAWLGLTYLSLDLRAVPPIRFGEPKSWQRGPFIVSPEITRFLLLVGAAGFGGLFARLAFGYWRLTKLSRDEARMMLLDTSWQEARRELNRQEKWRAWNRPGGTYTGAGRNRGWWPVLRFAFNAVLLAVAFVILGRVFGPILQSWSSR